MAVAANTVQTFQQIGIREDLADVITNIMPLETPLYSFAKKKKTGSRTPEWMRDIDADPDPTNAAIEGDQVANDAGTQPERLKNIVQLFDKVAEVSTTASAVNTAGRRDEMNFQVVKKGREIKRDMEARFQGNFASITGNTGAAGFAAGAEAYLTSNVSRGATGANGGFNSGTGLIAAATDGTLRVITEGMFKDVVAQTWINGGEDTTVLCGPYMKQKISSSFTGIATQFNAISGKNERVTIQGGIDIYKSDFGVHKIMPTRLGSYGAGRTRPYRPVTTVDKDTANRSVLVISPDTWAVVALQPMKQDQLAKLGHSERRMLSTECTLECLEERANGILADVKVA